MSQVFRPASKTSRPDGGGAKPTLLPSEAEPQLHILVGRRRSLAGDRLQIDMIRRIVAATVIAVVVTTGVAPLGHSQEGVISGRATGGAQRPYTDYNVQLVDVYSKQVTGTVKLDDRGRFIFMDVPVDQQYLVHLYSVRENRIACTEGPYALVSAKAIHKNDVTIDCNKPAAAWLLAAAVGTAATVAVVTHSNSR
jgi:hypothetical protein